MLRSYLSESPEQFEALVEAWQKAADASGDSLYKSPEWILSLWESHYGKSNVDFVADFDGGSLRAVFPLVRRRVSRFGLSYSQVEVLTNSYGQNHNELACFHSGRESADQFLDALDLTEWDVAYLTSVPEKSQTMEFLAAASAQRGHSLSSEPNVASPYLPLPLDWDTFLASKSANFRSDMRRKWNKGEAAGLNIKVVRGEDETPAALDAILGIEAQSWKQSEGTSISVQELSLSFYRTFLPKAAKKGWLRIYLVYSGARAVAYDMGILLNRKYYMLKTSFDDEFGKVSPGVYLRQYVVKELLKEGMTEHDFLGDAEPYKLRWTPLVRRHLNIYVYNRRSIRARALFIAKSLRQRLQLTHGLFNSRQEPAE